MTETYHNKAHKPAVNNQHARVLPTVSH